jgi:hypothetical protein
MDYGFVNAEDKKQARATQLDPQDLDIETLVNAAILRADPGPEDKARINVIEPARIEEWQKSFSRFRDWTWVSVH